MSYIENLMAELDLIRDDRHCIAVAHIIADLTDRGGLSDCWDQMDNDIRRDVAIAWIKILREHTL